MQHHVNCRLARAVVVPDAIPPERLERYGARGKIHAYPGLKEEYYLADFEPDPAVLGELGLDPTRPLVVVRTPPDGVALPPLREPAVRARAGARCAGRADRGAPAHRRAAGRAGGAAASSSPSAPIDAQSLVAYADLVISAGGTMNREAVALGTPVFTTFEGRLGAVDEALLREGRLRKLEDPEPDRASARRPRTAACASGAIRANSSQCCSPPANHEIPALLSERPPRRPGRRRRGCCSRSPTSSRTCCASTRGSRTATRSCSRDTIWITVPMQVAIFAAFGLYSKLWRFVDQKDFETILKATVVSHRGPDRRAVPVLDRPPRPAAHA